MTFIMHTCKELCRFLEVLVLDFDTKSWNDKWTRTYVDLGHVNGWEDACANIAYKYLKDMSPNSNSKWSLAA
jgi:hypothetical protein